MNEILQLKGKFERKDSGGKPGPSNVPKNKDVKILHLKSLKRDLISVRKFWENQVLEINPLISVYYIDVIAKSNRIKGILENSSNKNNNSVVGAKFTEGIHKKHIITHCIKSEVLFEAINNIEKVIYIVENFFDGIISYEILGSINNNKYNHIFSDIPKSRFVNTIVDAYYLESFGVEFNEVNLQENAIITLYNTGIKTSDIMRQLDINFLDIRSIDETTILLTPDQYNLLKSKAPYLISMAVSDISTLDRCDFFSEDICIISIPEPKNEPIIGVIDTLFDDSVYFSKWVKSEKFVDKDIPISKDDYKHGTMVTSIIVDGPTINPNLDDGCGRFRVRHFGVATSNTFSSFSVLRSIKEIIEKNRDIKVWNLSLGSAMEVNPNFISPEAAFLDKLQYENDIIFVVSGTNKTNGSKSRRIGAPADSINSIVVNSVDFNDEPASYSREGLVLSFFNKPDVGYYGGDIKGGISACSPLGKVIVSGTSFAAPWISRKVAYLINVLGLTRELAKALIIDSAAGWEKQKYSSSLIGFGVVPIHINDIIKTPKDEIKFMISGVSKGYDTYSYNFPIPEVNNKQPFISKATLCYFPNCSRNQGVDYTNTEMDIHFGRLEERKGKISIKTINDNKQSDEAKILLYEGKARELYRKWDNVKHIRENIKTPKGKNKKAKSKKGNGLWGISIKIKERLNGKDGKDLKFGVIVTLREVSGVNRIQEFIQQCQFRGWIVSRIDVDNRIDVYNKAEEEIIFDN